MKKQYLLISLFFVLLLVSCGDSSKETSTIYIEKEGPIEVYTTIFPLMDFTKKIGGVHVNVTNIVPIGSDAHTFEPTSKTMVDVSNSDLYIYNGVGLEGFANSAAKVLRKGNVKVLTATEGIELIEFDDHDHHHHHFFSSVKNKVLSFFGYEVDDDHDHHHHGDEDPHVWLDPIRSIQLAENIMNALIELKPSKKEEFEANFLRLQEKLEVLDNDFLDMLSHINTDTIVVSHAGYGYWNDRYGINQIGISGISPTNEPSIKQVQEVIEFIKENKINYVIFEQNIPTKIAETVRSQVGVEALWLHNLEALVQEDVANGEDYFSLMERNIETLRTALK